MKEGDKVRVRSLTVPKGYSFSYKYGIGCEGIVVSNNGFKNSRSVIVCFGDEDDVLRRESYYEDDLDIVKIIEENTIEKIEELWGNVVGDSVQCRDAFMLSNRKKINELVQVVNKLNKEIKELGK